MTFVALKLKSYFLPVADFTTQFNEKRQKKEIKKIIFQGEFGKEEKRRGITKR